MALPLAAPLGAPAVAVYRASPQAATTYVPGGRPRLAVSAQAATLYTSGGRPTLAVTVRAGGAAMPSKPFSISIPEGDSADVKLTLLDSSGAPFNPAGTDLTFTLRKAPSDVTPALTKSSSSTSQLELAAGDPANVVTVHVVKGDPVAGLYLASLVATDTLTGVQTTWTGTVAVTRHA